MKIGDLIAVAPVQTVIHLADGQTQPEAIARSFVFTPEVAAHFDVLTTALKRDTGRGYFLQGDFGSGKSHFLSALAALLGNAAGSAVLLERHQGLQELHASGRRFLAVPASLVQYRASTPLEQILVQNIEQALAQHGVAISLSPLAIFLAHFRGLLADAALAARFAARIPLPVAELSGWLTAHPREAYTHGVAFLHELGLPEPECLVEDRHETFARALAAVRAAGFSGVLFLIDELSEFLRAKPDARRLNEDARTLQFLGELADSEPLWLVAAVQESIERTGDIAQVTCRKIKDRFPVKFTLGTLHIRDLIARRLITRKPGADDAIRHLHDEFRAHFPGFSCAFEPFLAAYPVHPVTLNLLEGLNDLFSQHRGIVDFVYSRIAGDPSRHIPGILDRNAAELLAPDSLYEHFAPRLMEYSDFNVFPRHIVPHLDELIEKVLSDPGDRQLARRLVRILVLYHIHPTAATPTVSELAQLTACLLAAQDPELNAQFVGEAILEPLAVQSRFLARRSTPAGGRASEMVYELVLGDDPSKTLQTRLRSLMDGIAADDSRLLAGVLESLPESPAWPGPELFRNPLTRTVPWRGTQRRCLIALCQAGGESASEAAVAAALAQDQADFAFLFALGPAAITAAHTAVWRVPPPPDPELVLREYLAVNLLLGALRQSNPADAPLLEPARERQRRLAPAAAQIAVQALYEGSFASPPIVVERSALQLRRYDRLLEATAEQILELRYPRFAQIAPRAVTPSLRLYQRLLDAFIVPGSLSLHAARQQGLVEIIDGLAAPLGLVELRSGAYSFQPDTQAHLLLAYLIGRLRPAAPTPAADLLNELCRGEFGLPPETAEFLLLALAHAGAITLLNKGRGVPLEFLHLSGALQADAVALGELIPEAARNILVAECSFLAAQGADWRQVFGLKQQREAWQNLCRFREKELALLEDVAQRLRAVADYSAFRVFDLERYQQRLQCLERLLGEVKTSYQAREGLERFLAAWRDSALTDMDIRGLRALARFLSQYADSFIFFDHYLRHRVVAQAAADHAELSTRRDAALALLENPRLLEDEALPGQLAAAFQSFRDSYSRAYTAAHQRHTQSRTPELDRQGRRIAELLSRLAAVPELDRPAGLEAQLRQLTGAGGERCSRQVAELLLRAPVCDCGFDMHAAATTPVPAAPDPCSQLDAAMTAYATALRQPRVVEALQARAFALKDAAPAAAERLKRLLVALSGPTDGAASHLPDILDAATLDDLAQAVRGQIAVTARSLDELLGQLAGRRLQPAQIRAALDAWLGKVEPNTLLALELSSSTGSCPPGWWPLTRPELAPLHAAAVEPGRLLARSLEEQFPVSGLRTQLAGLANPELARLLAGEPFHLQLLREAWLLLADRVLTGQGTELSSEVCTGQQADPTLQVAMTARLAVLQRLQAGCRSPFPERLCSRLELAAIHLDSWATDRLQAAVDRAVTTLEQRGADWLASLPAVPPLDLASHPVILLLDAVPPDVWLAALARAPELVAGAEVSWQRSPVAPETRAAICHLFGFSGNEPLAEFAARGIPCHRLAGNEAATLADLLPQLPDDRPAFVHMATFDRGAHSARLRLPDMPTHLADLLARRLPQLRAVPGLAGRPLLVTSDHGLSFHRGALNHGASTVFELAVPRLMWPRAADVA